MGHGVPICLKSADRELNHLISVMNHGRDILDEDY
jgi:hypothetical protein